MAGKFGQKVAVNLGEGQEHLLGFVVDLGGDKDTVAVLTKDGTSFHQLTYRSAEDAKKDGGGSTYHGL